MTLVTCFDEQEALPISLESLKEVVTTVMGLHGVSADEVVVHLVTKSRISALHDEFFDDPSPTDCISFPIEREKGVGHHILGEIFVCPQTAIDYVRLNEDVTQDPYLETTLYIVHGFLHLIGYDDQTPEEAQKMRLEERRSLEHLLQHKIFLQKS